MPREAVDQPSTPPPRRPRPVAVIMAVGVALAAVVAASGLRAAVAPEGHASPVSRPVFANVPSAYRAVLYTATSVLLVGAAHLLAQRARLWQRGRAEARRTASRTLRRRLAAYRRAVLMRTVVRDGAAGAMHSLIYFPFLVLFAVTVVLEVDHQLPAGAKFLHGDVYRGYSAVGDVAGALFLVGVGWALARRYLWPPEQVRSRTRPEDAAVLVTLALLGLSGLLVEGARIALAGRPDFERFSVVGWPLSGWFGGLEHLAGWHQALWVAHVLAFFAFLILVPTTKLRHMVTSPLNMYLSDRDRPKGAMRAMPDLETTALESFGAAVIEDFSWKQLLDTDACTVCGRCTQVCPAHLTGKTLDPREIVLKVGQVMADSAPGGSAPAGPDGEVRVASADVLGLVTPEELWACTACRACDEVCPVNIEILDKILDMRRHLTLMESSFPTELGATFRALENQANPWGLSQADRGAWAGELPEPVPVVDGSGPFDHEYLYWVGCAGAYDDRNRKVTLAVASLLQRAGVDFAILGPAERCTGDPARRSGNEYLFQVLAKQNVATLNGLGVRKIVTQCPHCLNTLGREYPQLGGTYEVVHHTQLIAELVDSGRLDVSGAELEGRIVYHDSCYLGRQNDVYLAPRRVVGSLGGIEVVEAPRNGTNGLCCGAGGARMWMEETEGTRINLERSRELLATGAGRIATACPFCYVMVDDGARDHGRDDVVVADVAVHLAEALDRRRGPAG